MDILAEIQQRLLKYPTARYEVDGNTLTVLPDCTSGFAVGVTDHSGSYTVFFNGWHEEFTDATETLNCFAFGLSEDCRLEEWRRGEFTYKWTTHYRQGDEWIGDRTTGLFIFPFWKPAVAVYLQNHIIPAAETDDKQPEHKAR